MSSSATLIRASLAGCFLAGLAFAAPASATPYSAQWLMYTGCKQIQKGTGNTNNPTCQTDGQSGTPKGNEDQFTSTSGRLVDVAAFHTDPVFTTKTTGSGIHKVTTTTYTQGTYNGSTHTYQASNGGPGSADVLSPSLLGEYTGSTYGLGVENLAAPDHAIDNQSGEDFVALQFLTSAGAPAPISGGNNKISFTVSPFGTTKNMSFTIYYGSVTVDTTAGSLYETLNGNKNCAALPLSCTATPDVTAFAGVTVAQMLAGGFTMKEFADTNPSYANLYQATSPQTVGFYTTSVVNYIIIAAGAASLQNEVDYFKLNALTVTVPEPANLAVFAGGLAGLGMMARRRRRKAA
ncbi:MAG TPA: PEP-CTERM sorting domain-containing protein [Rhizomicrobium sp.]|nr:PEP-CTERM sorting domain-containing protein [Rhizomicrobium sp.]